MSIVDTVLQPVAGFDAHREMGHYVYDQAKADKAVEFFPDVLRHVQGSHAVRANQPFELCPWQETIVRMLFGIIDPATQLRRFRQCYIEIPRKNGKTTFAAGLILYGLFCDNEAAAQCIAAAASRDQARLLFDISSSMVHKSEVLKGASKVNKSQNRIIYGDSYIRAVAADADKLHGLHTHIVVADEVHAWAGGGHELWGVLETGCAARPQPLMIGITTAGHDQTTKCYELHQYSKSVRDGKIDDPSFLPVVFGIEPTDDWKDPASWFKANPNLEVSLPIKYLEQQCAKAQESMSFQNTFRRLHLNQWTSQRTRWLDVDKWDACHVTPAI